jgi:hypothetical protein
MRIETVSVAVPFSGPAAEREANRATHVFDSSDPDTRCPFCDCRPSHKAASYPCGATVPRELVSVE